MEMRSHREVHLVLQSCFVEAALAAKRFHLTESQFHANATASLFCRTLEGVQMRCNPKSMSRPRYTFIPNAHNECIKTLLKQVAALSSHGMSCS